MKAQPQYQGVQSTEVQSDVSRGMQSLLHHVGTVEDAGRKNREGDESKLAVSTALLLISYARVEIEHGP